MTNVKICCIQNKKEAALAASAGADAIGLVGHMPSGPGPIPDNLIAEIAAGTQITTVLLTSEVLADGIIAHVQRCRPDVVQLVDTVPGREVARVRSACPGVRIMPVIHVNGPSAGDVARIAWQDADMLLLDSGSPNKAVKELGGTGRIHDWRISAGIIRECPVPVWLAGGLTPDNVADAIRVTRPHGVDVCSGLRTDGVLDPGLLSRFITAVRDA